MDILGKKGEQASEELQSVADAVEDLNSHLNALDNAVQQHDRELEQLVNTLQSDDELIEFIEDNREDIVGLKSVFRRFASLQSNYMENVDVLDSELKETNENVSRIESKISRLEKGQEALSEEIEDLKEKVENLESEFILDTNRQEWDIDSKLDSSEFESHEERVYREMSKLRTSINDLADKVDDDSIKVEEG